MRLGRGFRGAAVAAIVAVVSLVGGVSHAQFNEGAEGNVIPEATTFNFRVMVQRPAPCRGTDRGATTADATLFAGNGAVAGQRWCDATTGADPIFRSDVRIYSGDTAPTGVNGIQTHLVRVQNINTVPAHDANFFMYVDPASIQVRRCSDFMQDNNREDGFKNDLNPDGSCKSRVTVLQGSSDWLRFSNFWTIRVDREIVLAVGAILLDPPLEQPETFGVGGWQTNACNGTLLALRKAKPCELGLIRQAATGALLTPLVGHDVDRRNYRFKIDLANMGPEAERFLGYSITFKMTFRAELPDQEPNDNVIGER
jgi:hypothetical protein